MAGLAAALAVFLSGCADMSPAYNPVEWGRSAVRGVGSLFGESDPDQPPPLEPPPAEGRPYPNLASVPRPPKPTPSPQREAALSKLEADRQAAMSADSQLRATGQIPAAPPPPPVIADVPAPAPTPRSAAAAVPPPAVPAPMASPVPTGGPPPAMAQAQPPVATTSQRLGAVAFGRGGSTLSANGQRALSDGAALARTTNGTVRLVPAQVVRQASPAELLRARQDAILRALAAAGIPRERVRIDDAGGRRVDVYDLYVEN